MKKNILITGTTGFIGQKLVPALQASGYHVIILTRDKSHVCFDNVVVYEAVEDIDSQTSIHAVINLAGAPISKRWTATYKKTLISSRIDTTNSLVALIERLNKKPQVLISASAIGYYGAHDSKPLDESSAPNAEFTHTLCAEWEMAATQIKQYGLRLCIARLGIVFGKNGGALQKMQPPFKLGLGGRLGSGKQMFSWIHRDDVVSGFQFLLQHEELEGTFNFCSPNAVSNAEFTRSLASVLHRPAIFPMPALCVRLLFREMGDRLLLHGQNVAPSALKRAGFNFKYPNIKEALEGSIK